MRNVSKTLLLFVLLSLPFLALAGMSMSKGQTGTWEGIVSGNHCAIMNMTCPPSHKDEVPVFIPGKNGKYDFAHLLYFAGFPLNEQQAVFGKDVRIKGTVYKNLTTVLVSEVQIKASGGWKTVWTMPKNSMMNEKM